MIATADRTDKWLKLDVSEKIVSFSFINTLSVLTQDTTKQIFYHLMEYVTFFNECKNFEVYLFHKHNELLNEMNIVSLSNDQFTMVSGMFRLNISVQEALKEEAKKGVWYDEDELNVIFSIAPSLYYNLTEVQF